MLQILNLKMNIKILAQNNNHSIAIFTSSNVIIAEVSLEKFT